LEQEAQKRIYGYGYLIADFYCRNLLTRSLRLSIETDLLKILLTNLTKKGK